ncbi:Cellulose synthase-like protein D2 [Dendrobium catenatum]|uniref:Cellulose synthase-like protein D2 n=1 Tax=Dendrobium catenatum TaxID=906689 RepID=A0A2I0W446_9ASPA|nr:Cellulose synthase-like protein D2 [Dendrobium catenatum]
MSNIPFILNLDCDHYIYNSQALREGMCFMKDRGGDRIYCVQFPKRIEGIDPSDRYANHTAIANMFTDIRVSGGIMSDVHLTKNRSVNSSSLSSPADLDVSVNDISIPATTLKIPCSTTARWALVPAMSQNCSFCHHSIPDHQISIMTNKHWQMMITRR